METNQDKINCLKNLIRMMCCDGRIEECEKKFLFRTAKQLQLDIPDWNVLLREVKQGPQAFDPIHNRSRAIATLKAMIVMAKADRKVDKKEGDLLLQFAKSLDLSNAQWKQILHEIDLKTLYVPFESSTGATGSVLVLRDDFDAIDPLLGLMKELGIRFRLAGFEEVLRDRPPGENRVCFHVSPQREMTLHRARQLLEKAGEKTAAVLTRYQGHQVQYLLELGIRRCIIEPVYARDLEKLLAPQ
jgi:uncharacterized tellurite resistance protein B-like protein